MSSAPRQTSATPILDRLVPVPPPLRPKSDPKARWSKKFLLSLGIGSAVLAILLLGRLDATWADVLTGRAPLFKFLWTILVRFVLPLGVAVLIHECGHLITGLFVGYRFLSIRVGPLELAWPFRLSVSRHKPGDVAGLTRMGPRVLKAASIRAVFYSFGGSAANLITSLLVFRYSSSSPFLAILGVMSAFLGIGNLIPFERSIASDGKRILIAIFRREEIRRNAAVGQIFFEKEKGIFSEHLHPDFVSALIGAQDPSAATVVAHLLAHGASWETGPDDETARRIEIALRFLSHVPQKWHEQVCCAAGLFQANKRKNVELARAWLTELPQEPIQADLRLRIEAAILETQGDFTAALGHVERIEKLFSAKGHLTKRTCREKLAALAFRA